MTETEELAFGMFLLLALVDKRESNLDQFVHCAICPLLCLTRRAPVIACDVVTFRARQAGNVDAICGYDTTAN
jgi:hypothetical protein